MMCPGAVWAEFLQPHLGRDLVPCKLHKFADEDLRPKRNRFHGFIEFWEHVQPSPLHHHFDDRTGILRPPNFAPSQYEIPFHSGHAD